MKRWIALPFTLAAAVAMLVGVSFALAGTIALAWHPHLDRGFGVSGVARTSLPPKAEIEPFGEIAGAADGGVIVRAGAELRHYGPDGAIVGVEPGEMEGRFTILRPPEAVTPDSTRLVGVDLPEISGAVARYRPDGSPDDSFGTDGTSEQVPFRIQAVASLPSGAVLAAGEGVLSPITPHEGATYQVYVARFGADGRIDESFGRSGIVELHSEDGIEGAAALTLQGHGDEGVEVVTRYEAVALDRSGRLDPGFGEAGRATLPGPAVDAAAAPDEALLVAGAEPGLEKGEVGGFYAARYTAAGKLDPAYAGGAGIAVLDSGEAATAGAALFDPDGSVSIGGYLARLTDCPPGYSCGVTPTVVRFAPDGSPDAGFGRGGTARLSTFTVPYVSDYVSGVTALAPRQGGGAFVSGQGLGFAFVGALGADGSLDPGFGDGGFVTAGAKETSHATPSATGVDRTGDVYTLVNSDSGTGHSEAALVLRDLPGGRPDRSFGEDGRAYVPPYSEHLYVAPSGSSFLTSSQGSALVKLLPSGSLDPSFGEEGIATLPEGGGFQPGPMVGLADGDLLVAGELLGRAGASAAVVRYRPDGKLDRSFGKDGVAVAKRRAPWSWKDVTAIAADRRGAIVVAGGQSRSCCVESGALGSFEPDGRIDRSFGHGGTRRVGRHISSFYGLAIGEGHIFAAAGDGVGHSDRDLVYAFEADGGLDRGFGDGGVATAPVRYTGRGSTEPEAVVLTGRRIFLVRSGSKEPLVAFSAAGKRQRAVDGVIPRGPGNTRPTGPVAAPAGDDVVLAWTQNRGGDEDRGKEAEVDVEHVRLN